MKKRGSLIELTGRGDKIPSEISKNLDKKELETFDLLSQIACEIGLSQMYRKTNKEEVNYFLLKTEEIALNAGVDKIDYHNFSNIKGNWGEPIDASVFNSWVKNA